MRGFSRRALQLPLRPVPTSPRSHFPRSHVILASGPSVSTRGTMWLLLMLSMAVTGTAWHDATLSIGAMWRTVTRHATYMESAVPTDVSLGRMCASRDENVLSDTDARRSGARDEGSIELSLSASRCACQRRSRNPLEVVVGDAPRHGGCPSSHRYRAGLARRLLNRA